MGDSTFGMVFVAEVEQDLTVTPTQINLDLGERIVGGALGWILV